MTAPTDPQSLVERECICAEIAGENPRCILHGKGTMWAKENPDVCELAERLAALEAASSTPLVAPSDRSQRAVVEADDIVTLDVFLAAYADCSDGEVIASVIEPTDDLLTLGCLRRILAALQPPAADNATRTEDGLAERVIKWVCHNGGLLNEWASEWKPQGRLTLTAYMESRLRAVLRTTGQPVIAAAEPVGEADV